MGQSIGRGENDIFVCPEALLKEIGFVKDIHYSQINNKFLIKKCFFCSNESSLQIDSVSGDYNCTNCKNFGSYEVLKVFVYDEFGYSNIIPTIYKGNDKLKTATHETLSFTDYNSKYITPLWAEDNIALNWLKHTNKLSETTIKAFNLGLTVIDERHFITIPYFDNKNNIIYLKYRHASDEQSAYRSFVDSKINKPTLYNFNNIAKDTKEVFIVKNELDCWTLYELGWKDAVAIPQTETNPYKYTEPLKEKSCRINIVFSNKYVDKGLVSSTVDFIGKTKTYPIHLPQEIFKIFRNFEIQETKEIIDEALQNAKKPILIDIVRLDTAFADTIIELYQPKNEISLTEGINTPWKVINTHIPIFRWGNLVTIGADSGSGKTTWCLQWANYLAIDLGIPTLFLCLEMNRLEHIYKIIEIMLGEHSFGNIPLTIQAHNEITQKPYDVPLYIAEKVTERSENELLNTIEQAIIEHNLKVVFFDHFQFVTFPSSAGKNTSSALLYTQFANKMKFMAEKLGIVFVCLSQIRKINEDAIPTMDDLRESSGLKNDSNTVIMLHRRRVYEDIDTIGSMSSASVKSNYTLFSVEKVRLGGKEGRNFLKYSNGRLIDVPDEFIEDIEIEKRAITSKNKFMKW